MFQKNSFKKVNNKIFLTLIILSMLLTLVACTNTNNSDINEGNKNNEGNTDNEAKNNEANGKTENTEKTEESQKITIALDWTPNTNHTGLFVAKDKGFFKEQNLEVEILQMSNVEQLVASQQCEFGVSYQEGVTFARLNDIPVVSIAAVIQNNTSGFASLKSKGIQTPADFEGKRYGGWGTEIEGATIKALMDNYNADFSKVEILTTGVTDFFASSEKNADFSWVFYGWDVIAAEIKGVELNYIDLAEIDSDLNYYTPVLITSEGMIDDNPGLVKSFMEATVEGYEFAIKNPEEAGNILLENAPELDKDLVMASQKWLSNEYQAEAPKWGLQEKEVWDNYTKWLYERNLIEKMLNVEEAFTNEFIE